MTAGVIFILDYKVGLIGHERVCKGKESFKEGVSEWQFGTRKEEVRLEEAECNREREVLWRKSQILEGLLESTSEESKVKL